MNLDLELVDYMTGVSAFLEKAASADAQAGAEKKAVAEMIPQVVDTMITHGRVTAAEGTKLARLLTDPVKVLEILCKTAEQEADSTPFGREVPSTSDDVKTAAVTDRRGQASQAFAQFGRDILGNR